MAGAKNTRGLTSPPPPFFWVTCFQLRPYFRHWSLIGTFWGKSENAVIMLLACAACKPDPPPFIGEGAKNILIRGGGGKISQKVQNMK